MKKILKSTQQLQMDTKHSHYGYWRYIVQLVAINVNDVNINKLIASKLFNTGFTYGSVISGRVKTKGNYNMDNLYKRHLYCIAWHSDIDNIINNRITLGSQLNIKHLNRIYNNTIRWNALINDVLN